MSKELERYVSLMKKERELTILNRHIDSDIYTIIVKKMDDLLEKLTTEDYIELTSIINEMNNER
jgi:hypothetical protein